MKLFTSTTFNEIRTSCILDESTGNKQWFIEGCFAQQETPNRNGRIYPAEIMENRINNYIKEYVSTNRAIGELNHPEYIKPNPEKASHRIIELNKNGNDYIGKALILNTPQGRIIQGLQEGGVQMGISTRGAGSLKESKTFRGFEEVCDDYILSCFDVVHDPSGMECWVNGIYEGAEWVWEGEKLIQIAAEQARKKIDEGKLVEAFKNYLNTIGK